MAIEQKVVDFFAKDTMGVQHGGKFTLEQAVSVMNGQGWKVDQVCPMGYKDNGDGVAHGIILCTKVE